jgi:D,D-heptose 1,7-bisphosphate phosphatase
MPNRALFLDRDGVINIDSGYVYRRDDFQFQAGLFELCRDFQTKNYRIIIITNQSGVARGYYTEEDLQRLHEYMLDEFSQEKITITAIFYCVSADEAHPDRKPNPGLFLKAQAIHALDMPASVSIGDKERDIIAAQRAGVGTNILLDEKPNAITAAEYRVKNLREVVTLCI